MATEYFKKLALITVLLPLFTACAGVKVTQEVEMPARESGMVGAKKLAIFNLDGDYNSTFGARVESYFANIKVRGTPYFTVLERQMLDRIVSEQKMVSSSGLFDEKDAVKLGKLAGADTIVSGIVQMPKPAERYFQEEHEVCNIYKKRSDGRDSSECLTWAKKNISCHESVVNIDFTLKAISVQQGSIVFTKNYPGSAKDKVCDTTTLKSSLELQNAAIAQILASLRNDVAPYTTIVSIEFMEEDDVMSKTTKNKVKSAVAFIEQKRMDRACEIFKEAVASDTNSPALYYDMGVCAEISSDLDRAESLYNQADRKTTKPEALISNAINRVQQKKSNQLAVSQQIH